MKPISLSFFAFLLFGTLTAKATLTLDGASTDSTITIKYDVAESSHVQIKVSSTVGVHAAPKYGFQAPGNYTIVVDKSGFPREDYSVRLILDHDRKKVTRRSFFHSPSGRPVTQTSEERDLYNRCYAVTGFDQKQAVELWNELLTRYPDYVERGVAFLYSIMARIPATDSVDVHAAADSAAAIIPHSGTYRIIGRILSGLDGPPGVEAKYPRTALVFADMAVKHIGDVPEPYRNEALYRYQSLRGHCLHLLGRFPEAENAYIEAIRILESPGDAGTFSDFRDGDWAYRGLASLHEQRGMHAEAIELYEKAIKDDPRDPDLWMALQRNFNLVHGSNRGYVAYSRKLEAEIRGDAPENNDDLVGEPLPGFALTRLDGDTLTLEQVKGNVSVLNFWAFWCAPCMAELSTMARLSREVSARGVKVIAVHTPLEYVPGITKKEFPEIVKNAVRKYEGSFDTVWDSKEQNFSVRSGIRSLPVTLVADKEGIVRYRVVGFDPENAYRKLKAVVDSLNVLSSALR